MKVTKFLARAVRSGNESWWGQLKKECHHFDDGEKKRKGKKYHLLNVRGQPSWAGKDRKGNAGRENKCRDFPSVGRRNTSRERLNQPQEHSDLD